jgi:tetratricopeptide (TPR) repeat protein
LLLLKSGAATYRINISFGVKMILIISLFNAFGCGRKPVKHKTDSAAVNLNNRAISLSRYIHDQDSCKKAITLLDSATSIDSNYFLGYYNKLMFLNQLRQYDKAIAAVNHLIRIRPGINDLYLTGGMLFDKTGDTLTARLYFEKTLAICNTVLDTMNRKNRDYDILRMNKGISLVMLGQQKTGNQILEHLYDGPTDIPKELISTFINKSQSEILEQIFNPKPDSPNVSPGVEAR